MADGTRLNIQQWKISNGITHKKHNFDNFYFKKIVFSDLKK